MDAGIEINRIYRRCIDYVTRIMIMIDSLNALIGWLRNFHDIRWEH